MENWGYVHVAAFSAVLAPVPSPFVLKTVTEDCGLVTVTHLVYSANVTEHADAEWK